MKKVLFIDRDGTLTIEPNDFQLDTIDKLVFYPCVFQYLGNIVRDLDYELVMVTNQDGLGSESYPEADFWPAQNFLINTFKNEGIIFEKVFIDNTFPKYELSSCAFSHLLKSPVESPILSEDKLINFPPDT